MFLKLESATGLMRSIRSLTRDPMGLLGLTLVVIFLLMALLAPLISPYDPIKISVQSKFEAPNLSHWLGTDQLGRDTLSRIIYGSRTALSISLSATGLAGICGLLLGLIAGFGPRWLDGILVLLFDSMSSLPMILFALVIVLVSIPSYARLIRAQTLTLKNSEFVMAEKSIGASSPRIILLHLLPNVVGPLVIILSMDIPVVIMLEAGLSYLNLGVRPPTPSWGNILYDGYTSLRYAPTLVISAGVPLVLATLGFTFLGEGLRDALDPKLQVRGLR